MKQITSLFLALAFVLTGCITKSPVNLTPIPTNPEMAQLERSLTARMNMPPMPPMPTVSHRLMAAPKIAGPIFYDPFNSGTATPWTFYTGTHLFTSGILRLNAVRNNGAYAYVRTNWTNISVSADIKLGAGSYGGAVGLRYNPTNGASYQAWIYGSGRFAIKKYSNWFNTSTEVVGMSVAAPGTNVNNIKLTGADSTNYYLANTTNSPQGYGPTLNGSNGQITPLPINLYGITTYSASTAFTAAAGSLYGLNIVSNSPVTITGSGTLVNPNAGTTTLTSNSGLSKTCLPSLVMAFAPEV